MKKNPDSLIRWILFGVKIKYCFMYSSMYFVSACLTINKIQITQDVVVVLRLLSSFTNLIGKKEKRHPLWLICDLHNR